MNPERLASTHLASTKMSTAEWRVLILLVLSVCINYVDRGNLSIAAPMLTKELSLSPTNMGLLLSAFFWTYALFQIVAGWLVDRFNVNWVYAAGYLLWSVATAATGFIGGFASLFAFRLLLGIGESVAYPSYAKILANNFPETHRGLANALIDAGSKSGPAIGTLVCGLLMATYGWRAFFIALGLISLLWLLPWVKWAPRTPRLAAARDTDPGEMPSIPDILARRSAWGTFVGLFCGNYCWYFLLTWLPSYLVTARGFSLTKMATYGSLPYWGIGASSIFGGWLSDHLIRAGYSPTLVRKGLVCMGLFCCSIILPAAIVKDIRISMALLFAACLSFGLFTSNLWAVTQTLAGPKAAGKWTGLQNAFGNLAGIAAPWLTGWVVQETGEFYWAFVVTASMVVIGALSYGLIVGPVEAVVWPARPAAPADAARARLY